MDKVMLAVNLISMVATVVSCIVAVRSKNEANRILTEMKILNVNTGVQAVQGENVNNNAKIDIKNTGKNEGVIGGIITGGVTNSDK